MSDHPAALVTGASRGIGRAIALGLAADGYALTLAARGAEDLDRVAETAGKVGAPGVLCVAADFRDAQAPADAVRATTDRFGRLDVLVNNAGATQRGDFLELDDDVHLDGFALKYHAMVRFCRAAWPALSARRGAIVNISGVGAHTPEPAFTVGGPVNSAIINFSKALSKRPEGVRVNVVCPGHIETDRLTHRIETLALSRGLSSDAARDAMRSDLAIAEFGAPEDIAEMVRYLCSPRARYVTGATFTVDGGATPGI